MEIKLTKKEIEKIIISHIEKELKYKNKNVYFKNWETWLEPIGMIFEAKDK